MKYFIKLISFLFKKYCIESPKFKPSSLIIRDGTRTLFEVDCNYYNMQFEPVTIVRAYPMGTQLMGISKHEIKEFKEYKKMPDATFSVTDNDNDKFAKYK